MEQTNQINWAARYSDTDHPDKFGRWAREGYVGRVRVAWISRVGLDGHGAIFTLRMYVPTNGNDDPCYMGTSDKVEDLQARAEEKLRLAQAALLPQLSPPPPAPAKKGRAARVPYDPNLGDLVIESLQTTLKVAKNEADLRAGIRTIVHTLELYRKAHQRVTERMASQVAENYQQFKAERKRQEASTEGPNGNGLTYYCDEKRHLICLPYSIDNLHRMARHLGIGRHFFHASGGKWHYDIPARRIEEIRSRCTLVSEREIYTMINKHKHTAHL